MPSYNYIHETQTGVTDTTHTFTGNHHGIFIDNQSSTELFFTPANDGVKRRIPPNDARGIPFAKVVGSVAVEASGYYEISTYL